MMEEKVDLRKLKPAGTYPSMYEKLVLELAAELQRLKDPDEPAVTWACQEEAMNYFNAHGFVKTLDYLMTLRRGAGD